MYKTSFYNLFVPYKDKVVYANLLQESSFLLTPAEDERIQQQLSDPISFELGYPSVFAQFKKWGFIVDDRVDELALLRNRVIKRFYRNRNYHLIIHTGEESDMQIAPPVFSEKTIEKAAGWLDGLKNHIAYMIKQEKIESLCLEFVGGEPLLQFSTLIEPLCEYIRHHWKEIPFFAQLETNGLMLLSYCRSFDSAGIGSVKIIVEANERRHDKIRHEKGVPTYRRICANIVTACKSMPSLQCLLQFNCAAGDDPKELQATLDSFPSNIRSRITLSFNYTDGGANAIEQILQKKNSMEDQLDKPGFRVTDPLQAGAGWKYPADEHYYVRTVFPDGTFYIGKQDAFIPTLPALGKLDIKTGELAGNEIQEYRAANLNWFETQPCRSCRLLPAIYPVCSRACRQADPALVRSVCPLERKAFGEDDFVVLLFEQKETLIRQLMAK